MSTGWSIFVASFIASLGVVAASASLLLVGQQFCRNLIPRLVSFAVGTLLAGAFLGLLPSALAGAAAPPILQTTLIGILVFFLLEKLLIWRHCHSSGCETHDASGLLIVVGDAFHNFVDGIVIAAAFLQSATLGLSTTLAVIAHEVPQEVGDFAILLNCGYSRTRAIIYNLLSASTTLAGAGLAYVTVGRVQQVVPIVLAFSAASFIYIGVADLIPVLHRDTRRDSGLEQIVLVVAGVALIATVKRIVH